jgi:hypothetical protein
MHGMINRGLQCYIRDIHGVDVWEETCEQAKLPFYNFESMLTYDDATTENLLTCFGELVDRSRDEILEDFGTYVVSEDALSAVRRLLKFGGANYAEFLLSLNFVSARAKMAIPDLDIPMMEVITKGPCEFILYSRFQKRGFGATLLGLLRALADDYNTLVTIEHFRKTLKYVDEDVFTINLLQEGWFNTVRPALVQH